MQTAYPLSIRFHQITREVHEMTDREIQSARFFSGAVNEGWNTHIDQDAEVVAIIEEMPWGIRAIIPVSDDGNGRPTAFHEVVRRLNPETGRPEPCDNMHHAMIVSHDGFAFQHTMGLN